MATGTAKTAGQKSTTATGSGHAPTPEAKETPAPKPKAQVIVEIARPASKEKTVPAAKHAKAPAENVAKVLSGRNDATSSKEGKDGKGEERGSRSKGKETVRKTTKKAPTTKKTTSKSRGTIRGSNLEEVREEEESDELAEENEADEDHAEREEVEESDVSDQSDEEYEPKAKRPPVSASPAPVGRSRSKPAGAAPRVRAKKTKPFPPPEAILNPDPCYACIARSSECWVASKQEGEEMKKNPTKGCLTCVVKYKKPCLKGPGAVTLSDSIGPWKKHIDVLYDPDHGHQLYETPENVGDVLLLGYSLTTGIHHTMQAGMERHDVKLKAVEDAMWTMSRAVAEVCDREASRQEDTSKRLDELDARLKTIREEQQVQGERLQKILELLEQRAGEYMAPAGWKHAAPADVEVHDRSATPPGVVQGDSAWGHELSPVQGSPSSLLGRSPILPPSPMLSAIAGVDGPSPPMESRLPSQEPEETIEEDDARRERALSQVDQLAIGTPLMEGKEEEEAARKDVLPEGLPDHKKLAILNAKIKQLMDGESMDDRRSVREGKRKQRADEEEEPAAPVEQTGKRKRTATTKALDSAAQKKKGATGRRRTEEPAEAGPSTKKDKKD